MRTYKALVSGNEMIEVDDTSDPNEVLQFLLKHRLNDIEIRDWISSLDHVDNGFAGFIRFRYPEDESFVIKDYFW